MKGRPPTPTSLKLLRGNPGKRASDGRAEVSMPPGTPEPPQHLSPGAKQEFFRVVKFLAQVHGLLTPTDHAAIGIYCSYYDQWQQAEEQLPALRARLDEMEDRLACRLPKRERTALEKAAGRTRANLNLALGERNKARKEMRAYLVELGLTPAARTRVRVPNGQGELNLGDKPDNPLDAARRALGA